MSDAARLQELEDRETIRQIFTDYARYLDHYDHAGYASLFARDGVFGEAVGREAIGAQMAHYVERVTSAKAEGRFRDAVHVMSNHDIVIDGDTARADITWCYMTRDADEVPTVFQMGHYLDDLVREDGQWKIARHTITRSMGRAQLEAPHPTRLDETNRRLQALEDKEAIMRLCMRIQDALDGRDLKDYGDCFTKDGVWSGVTGRYVGPKAITEFFTRVCPPWETPGHSTYHTTSDFVIDLDGDMARARSQWRHIMRGEKDAPVIVHHGHYDDEFRRTAEGWRFTKRAAFGDIPYFEPKFQLIGEAKPDEIEA